MLPWMLEAPVVPVDVESKFLFRDVLKQRDPTLLLSDTPRWVFLPARMQTISGL